MFMWMPSVARVLYLDHVKGLMIKKNNRSTWPRTCLNALGGQLQVRFLPTLVEIQC